MIDESLTIRNIVVAANYFNISVFKESWFINQKVLNEDDIDATKSFFTPNFIQVENSRFQLVINPNQIMFALKANSSFEEFAIVNKIITNLPHTPYSAIGFNFNYFKEDKDGAYSSSLFYNKDNVLYKDFSSDDNAQFGAYLSKDYLNSRLKLDIKPVILLSQSVNEEKQYLRFHFNFHKGLKSESLLNNVEEMIKQSNAYYNYSFDLISKVDNLWQ